MILALSEVLKSKLNEITAKSNSILILGFIVEDRKSQVDIVVNDQERVFLDFLPVLIKLNC